jgi:NitT/TauT family transport system ATP-binding protein/taurine transport system ATP-binding protein
MDIPIDIPRDTANPEDMEKVRSDPRFVELRERITEAIYEQDDQQ